MSDIGITFGIIAAPGIDPSGRRGAARYSANRGDQRQGDDSMAVAALPTSGPRRSSTALPRRRIRRDVRDREPGDRPADSPTSRRAAQPTSTPRSAAARRAFDDGRWSRRAPAERKKVLLRFADLLEANLEELAMLDSLEAASRSPTAARSTCPRRSRRSAGSPRRSTRSSTPSRRPGRTRSG